VTNEGSVGYELYNWDATASPGASCGAADRPSIATSARQQNANFLAYATRPDGAYETIGDTRLGTAVPFNGTIAQYAATLGRQGPTPSHTMAVYGAATCSVARLGVSNTAYKDEDSSRSGSRDHGSSTARRTAAR